MDYSVDDEQDKAIGVPGNSGVDRNSTSSSATRGSLLFEVRWAKYEPHVSMSISECCVERNGNVAELLVRTEGRSVRVGLQRSRSAMRTVFGEAAQAQANH